jgi:hypothetical protein
MFVPLLSIGGLMGLGAGCSVPILSPAQIYQYAISAGFPDNPPGQGVATQMVAIALRESAGCPTATNLVPPDNSWGLWQINVNPGANAGILTQLGLSDPSQLLDPATNAAAAFAIWGGNPNNLQVAWAINTPGYAQAYQNNLPAAQAAALSVSGASGADTVATDDSSDSGSFVGSLGVTDQQLAIGAGLLLAGLALVALT